jgi:hypothetical protein
MNEHDDLTAMSERELVVLDYDEAGNPIYGYADEQALRAMFYEGETCSPCGGSGWDDAAAEPCFSCNGTGWIDS